MPWLLTEQVSPWQLWANVGTGALSRYENDKIMHPDIDALRRIARVLALRLGEDESTVWNDIEVLVDRLATNTRLAAVAEVATIRRGKRGHHR